MVLQDPSWNALSVPSAAEASQRNRIRIRCSLEAQGDCLGRVSFGMFCAANLEMSERVYEYGREVAVKEK